MIRAGVFHCALVERSSRTAALSRALRKFERSRAPKALGVVCPVERRWSIRSRVASAAPIEVSLKRFPLGAMTSAPEFTHRLASGTSEVTTMALGSARPLSDPVVRGVRVRPDDNPLDLGRTRDHVRAVRDDEDIEPVANRETATR